LEAVAKVLGVSVSFLMTGREEIREVETAPQTTETVASIIEDVRAKIAKVTGLALERVKMNVQFTTE